MEPIRPTTEALGKLDQLGATAVQAGLQRIAGQVEAIVPQCVGLSLSLLRDNVTFTLVATDLQAAALDAFQELAGGPCVQAVHDDEVLDVETALSEEHWSMDARATAAEGIQSSLSMPLVDRARVVGGVNLYASAPGVFEDHIDEVAEAVGAWAPAAVRDADLSFSSRLRAAEAPGVLANQADVDMATGLLAASQHIDTTTAEQRLSEAAERVGIAPAEVARTVIEVHTAHRLRP